MHWHDRIELRILLGRWLVNSGCMQDAKDMLYLFEKPWKFNAEFFDMLNAEGVSLVLKCVGCKMKIVADEKQIAVCKLNGFAVCKCGFPAYIDRVTYLPEKALALK